MVKAINVLKIISAIVFLITLLFVYSLLPVMVNINPEEIGWSLHKEYFFYGLLTFFIVINVFLIFIERMISPLLPTEDLKAWVKGFSFVINLYLSFLLGYVGVLNNQNHFQQGSYAYLNYLGPILVFAWVVGLILFFMKSRKTA